MDASDILQAVVLGVVQGIAEFLPISSSGHLVIAGALLQDLTGGVLRAPDLTMNVALHVGTLGSILAVYYRDLVAVARQLRLLAAIVVATIPVGVCGLAFHDVLKNHLQTPTFAAFALLATAGLLVIAQRRPEGTVEINDIGLRRALVIGLFQAVAIVPGISRSGSTIAGGLMTGLQRNSAATFSFLIAIPAIAGAGFKEVLDYRSGAPLPIAAALIGSLTAFVVGYFSLKWLLSIVARGQLHWFAIYCMAVAVVTLAWQAGF